MADPELTPIPGGELRYDDDGHPIVDVATCGHCGRSWNDALSSSVTPAPSGRCPFEYEHVYDDAPDYEMSEDRKALILLDAMLHPELYPRAMQPDHVYWDGVDEDDTEAPAVFEWSADTIEWVSEYLSRYLDGDPAFRPTVVREMNEAQTATFAQVNDAHGIARWQLAETGRVLFVADDGDPGVIEPSGAWRWK